MTGMTDISRHGGDKSNRGELDITVKDDALVDPALLDATGDGNMVQFDNLVDDSDDDDAYDLTDSGPGMAAKIVQSGFKVLFFPLVCVYKGIVSLKYTPQLCGRIWQGLKQGPGAIRHIGPFLKSLFSSTGWVGRIVILVGTYIGVVWVCRKIASLGASWSAKRAARQLARQQADEEAALEQEILAEEAALAQASQTQTSQNRAQASSRTQTSQQQQQASNETPLRAQSGNGSHKATVQFAASSAQPEGNASPNSVNQTASAQTESENESETDTEHDTPRRSRFGNLSRFANAFRRSAPLDPTDETSTDNSSRGSDTLSISSASNDALVDDNYDPFAATDGRWSAKKRSIFAAACLVLVIGGIGVAKQVLQKDADVAAKTSDVTKDDNQKNQSQHGIVPSNGQASNTIPDSAPNYGNFGTNSPAPNSVSTRSWSQPQAPSQVGENDNHSSLTAMTIPAAPGTDAAFQSASTSFGSGFQSFQTPANGSDNGSAVAFSDGMQTSQSGSIPIEVEGDDAPGVASGGMFAQNQTVDVVNPEWQTQSTDASTALSDTAYATDTNVLPANTEPMIAFGTQPVSASGYDVTSNEAIVSSTAITSNGYGNNGFGTDVASQSRTGFALTATDATTYDNIANHTAGITTATSGDSYSPPYSATNGFSNQGGTFSLHDSASDNAIPANNTALADNTMPTDDLPVTVASAVSPEEYAPLQGFSSAAASTPDVATVATVPTTQSSFDLTGGHSTDTVAMQPVTTHTIATQPVSASAEVPYADYMQADQQTNLTAMPRMQPNGGSTGFSIGASDQAVAEENAPPLTEVFARSQSVPNNQNDTTWTTIPEAQRGSAIAINNTPPVATGSSFALTPNESLSGQPLGQQPTQASGLSPENIASNAILPAQPTTTQQPVVAQMAMAQPIISQPIVPQQTGVMAANDVLQNNAIQTNPQLVGPEQAYPMHVNVMPTESVGQTNADFVAPSQHMAAVPMISPPTRRNENAASNNFPPMIAQADTPAPPYTMQPHVGTSPTEAALQNLTPLSSIPNNATNIGSISNNASNGMSNASSYVYVVQEGDDIFSIAKQELGRVRRYREIYELNRDRLPVGQNTLTAGMELLIPGN